MMSLSFPLVPAVQLSNQYIISMVVVTQVQFHAMTSQFMFLCICQVSVALLGLCLGCCCHMIAEMQWLSGAAATYVMHLLLECATHMMIYGDLLSWSLLVTTCSSATLDGIAGDPNFQI